MSSSFRRIAAATTAAALLLALPASASSSFDYSAATHWANRTELVGSAKDVALTDGYAFVAEDPSGLVVLDRSTSPPAVVATVPTPGKPRCVFLDGTTLYLGETWNTGPVEGLRIYDVSAPATPVFLGMYPVTNVWDVYASGTVAYVTSDGPQLLTLDVSTPAAPSLLGSIPVDGWEMTVEGTLAFAGGDIIDVSVPTMPIVLSSDPFGLSPVSDVVASGNLVYLAGGFMRSINIIDITYPQNPVLRSTILSYTDTVALAGSLLLATGDQPGPLGMPHYGLHCVDVTDPDAPVHVAAAPWDVNGRREIAVDGTEAFVAGVDVHAFDLSILASPVEQAGLAVNGLPAHIATFGDLAAVSTDTGLEMVDLSGPAPVSLGFAAGALKDATLDGGLVYAVSATELQVFDVSVPATPTMVGSAPLTNPFLTVVEYRSPFAYAAGQRLEVFDCSNPASPSLVPMPAVWWYIPTDLAFDGDWLCVVGNYAPNQYSLAVYDAAPEGPVTPLGSWDTPFSSQPEKLNGIAVLPDHRVAVVGDVLRIFDISDPSAPNPVSSHALPAPGLSVVHGTVPGTLLIATEHGLAVADVTDPYAPTVRGVFASDTVRDLALDTSGRPTLAVSTSSPAEITVLPAAGSATGIDAPVTERFSLGVFPNPSTAGVSFALPGESLTERRLDVFDVTGRRVWGRTLLPGTSGVVRWDGRDVGGLAVPAGVYFVRYDGREGSLSRKVTLVR